jgi:TATA-binding protein-associated factor Taf7
VLRLFYDVARAFVVTRDLRPGELMESECKLPSTADDFKGFDKKVIYQTLADRMQTHLDGAVRPLESTLDADNRPGFHLLINRAETLIEVVREANEVVGTKPPERFVIGNRARPKMSPAEEEAMLKIDAALTGLISVRKR